MSYATQRCDWCDGPLKTWSYYWRNGLAGAFCSEQCRNEATIEARAIQRREDLGDGQ
jgi:hypothetical protein